MGKILHIVTDEKFTDYAISQFSAPEMQSEFVLIPSNFGPGDVVKQMDKVMIVQQNSPEFADLLKHLGDYSAIVLHGMHWGRWETPILEKVPKNVKVAWVLWGGDVYGRADISNSFLSPISRFLSVFHFVLRKLFGRKIKSDTSWEINKGLFKRVDFCLTSQLEELNYAKQYADADFKHLWYTYYNLEEMIGSLLNSRCTGKNIWLGNSATLSNNHLTALYTLQKKRKLIRNRKITTPLSYGSAWLSNIIRHIGHVLFGSNFYPLLTYIPREDYNKLMLDCGTMIMPHYMSQAMGNIYTGLWLGMRVYMSEKNISYHYLKRIGIAVFSFESDFNKYGCTPITEEEFQQNRAVLTKWYGKEHVMQAAKKIVKVLSSNDF